MTAERQVVIAHKNEREIIWDFAHRPLIGCAVPEVAA